MGEWYLMKKAVLLLSFVVIIVVGVSCIVLAKSFNDVPDNHWANTYIDKLSNLGIINGYEDGTFRPNGNVTQAEFLKLIMTAFKSSLYFDDFNIANAKWYDKYFIVAEEEGYLTGGVNSVLANEPITRLQIMKVLSNIIEKNKLIKISIDEKYSKDSITYNYEDENIQKEVKEAFDNMEIKDQLRYVHVEEVLQSGDFIIQSDLPEFKDTKGLSDDDVKTIDLVVYSGLITGYEDGSIRPNNNVTRAEVTTIISRFYDKFGTTISK